MRGAVLGRGALSVCVGGAELAAGDAVDVADAAAARFAGFG